MMLQDKKRLGALLMAVGVLFALPALLLGHLPLLGAVGVLAVVTGSLLVFGRDSRHDNPMSF